MLKNKKLRLAFLVAEVILFLRGINTLQSQTVQLQKTFGELI